MNTDIVIYILDLIGCAGCAAAASVLAKRVGFDFTGAVMIGAIGAIGGGTVRDLLINRHPIFWLKDLNYLCLITAVALLVQIFYHAVERLDKPLRWFDAVGLAAFSVIGFQAALSKGFSAPIVVLMGVITAVMGGIIRDIICRQLPLVLRQEIYIVAAISGGIWFLLLQKINISLWINHLSTMLFIFSFRMFSVYQRWNLPSITLPAKTPQDPNKN
ncbi:trimeric intracellular cation channel family protein [Dichelobacter nodosus]|uniref:Conserved hypothetical membrane protein n=1 Tax=Dichelobacter nodosus (strain VCS1703A) TaxID=246195 RepID=A5EWW8_DICNV|nr:trimeric intracellular cation channel family protein [Dichelobacter nodosus]ABQ13508.1 conserved hypothetical membrane protein [Dichelobacter nodosus VCS1703A]KNZ39688.1 membrane protein [Dichelobacter nodosus]TGA65843.1 trimeric intracellular cation channel family protein [Dichelobacter nodosus]